MRFSAPLDAVPTRSNADSTSDEHAHSAAVSNQTSFNPRRLGWPAPSVVFAWLAVRHPQEFQIGNADFCFRVDYSQVVLFGVVIKLEERQRKVPLVVFAAP